MTRQQPEILTQNESRYWLVAEIDYEQSVKLANSELIEHFGRNQRTNSSQFWPGTTGVLNYLRANLPEGASIVNEGTQAATKEASRIKKPIIIHRMGQDIDND